MLSRLRKKNICLLRHLMFQNENGIDEGWGAYVAESERGVSFFRNTIVRVLLVINVVFLCASFLVLRYFIQPTESLFILHYNVYFGVEIQGIWWQVFILPFVGVLFFFSHLFFAYRFYRKSERIAAYLMLFGSWLISIGIVIASADIAFINY